MCMYMCLCVYVYVDLGTHVCACVWVCIRCQLHVSSSDAISLVCSFSEAGSLAWSLLIQPGWLSSKPQASACVCVPSAEVTSACCCFWFLHMAPVLVWQEFYGLSYLPSPESFLIGSQLSWSLQLNFTTCVCNGPL